MIKLTNISCGYENRPILKNVSFSLAKHTHLTIFGLNGSGKSTLAKAICGLIDYKGSITINGEELRTLSHRERARRISYIPAKIELFEQYNTLEEFVLLGRYPHKASFQNYTEQDHHIAREALKTMKIDSLAARSLHTLSSGQQQMALIAQALTQKSEIIIFDEPTANLDPANSLAFALQLVSLREKGISTILITHDLHLGHHMKAPVLFVDNGTVEYFADPTLFFSDDSLQHRYAVTFSHRALGVVYD